jgi:hypothetical protein
MNERKTREIMAAPDIISTMPEEVSPASPMKRDRSTSPTVTASPERSPSVLRSMRTNTPTTENPTIRISRASI